MTDTTAPEEAIPPTLDNLLAEHAHLTVVRAQIEADGARLRRDVEQFLMAQHLLRPGLIVEVRVAGQETWRPGKVADLAIDFDHPETIVPDTVLVRAHLWGDLGWSDVAAVVEEWRHP